MTIRELISCMDSGACQKFHIRADNGWVKLFVDLDDQKDPDLIMLDALADMHIKSWYVNPAAEIVIFPEEELNENQIQLFLYYGFRIV